MRLGFLGGSFDPIHVGHVQMAMSAVAEAQLERAYFLPTGQNWQKSRALAPVEQRIQWAQRAAECSPQLGVLDIDATRPGPIYTADTLQLLDERFPGSQLFLILGGDQLANLHTWHRAAELAERAHFFVFMRQNFPFTQPQLPGLRVTFAQRELPTMSSSEIRERLKSGQSVRGMVPEAIESEVVHFYSSV